MSVLSKVRIYRQGDLVLEQVEHEDVVRYAEPVSDRLEVRSETGNAHVLNAKVYRYADQMLVVVEKPTPLMHPQHPAIVIEPGVYRVRFVRDWLLESARPVD
jgi:hypothetical protein